MQLSKYSASGNDFVIFHTFIEEDRSELAKELCNRSEGVGADGLIVLLPSSENDFKWQFYNSDGSIAEMCGNGSRAAAHYAYTNGLVSKNSFNFLTLAGVIGATVEGDIVESQLTPYKIIKDDFKYKGFDCWIVDTGVPHVVVSVDDINKFDLEIARELRHDYNGNVNFVEDCGDHLKVRTFERGVEGETLACGTGMAACFLKNVGSDKNTEKKVFPKSGEQLILKIDDNILYLKGQVRKTFDTFVYN